MNTTTFINSISSQKDVITSYLAKHPPVKENGKFIKVSYGTSGFRSDSKYLDNVMLKCALFQIVNSFKSRGEAVGFVITASHNPPKDNGIKLSTSSGKFLTPSQEATLMSFVNKTPFDFDDFLHLFDEIQTEPHSDNRRASDSDEEGIPTIFLGRDSRDSSDHFHGLLRGILSVLENAQLVHLKDFGYCSTPQLLKLVGSFNKGEFDSQDTNFYTNQISEAFVELVSLTSELFGRKFKKRRLFVDCANGVASLLIEKIAEKVSPFLEITCYNRFREGNINEQCGAEFIHKRKGFSKGHNPTEINATLDGDADRILFFWEDKHKDLTIVDGDKLLTLFAKFFLALDSYCRNHFLAKNSIKAVQTAYANGNSTRFLREELRVPSVLAGTGVKKMEPVAAAEDVGIYFEANGHGTVVFSEKLEEFIRDFLADTSVESNRKEALALKIVLAIIKITNQTYADAISTLFMAEIMLFALKIDYIDLSEIYRELPFMNKVLKVTNKNFISALSDDETRVLKPEGMQRELNSLAASFGKGRCFVRPSGTEDFVRIYAEAADMCDVEKIISGAVGIVGKYHKDSL